MASGSLLRPADGCAGMSMIPIGFSIPANLRDRLDEMKREWDEREARSVSRSDVAREALAVGTIALDELEDHDDNLDTRAREAVVRQAIQDHFGDE